jgi:hypothetical protein
MAKYCFIRASAVRKLAKDYGKNCSADFLEELDIFIHLKVGACCKLFNGHRKRLTGDLIKHTIP